MAHRKQLDRTCAERDNRCVGPAEEAGVDIGKLCIEDANKLLVARIFGAVRGRRNDTAADVVGVARVLAVRDRRGDKVCLVRDAVRLGKVDHVIRVVLLVADVARRKERVDAVDTG